MPHYKYMDIPNFNYGSSSYDAVLKGGRTVGFSMFGGTSFNERRALSLGVQSMRTSRSGEELTLLWGEESGGTNKATVERHTQARSAREGCAGALRSRCPARAIIRAGVASRLELSHDRRSSSTS